MAQGRVMSKWCGSVAAAAVSFLVGCERSGTAVPAGFARAEIGGETFLLETAMDNETRTQGLSGREEIAADGGMIFVFAVAQQQSFVMRDCLVPIDIVYVTDNQRVLNFHSMEVDPRRPNEPVMVYERRLKKYSSEGRVRLVIELAGGTVERLGLAVGDRVVIEGLEGLKSAAR